MRSVFVICTLALVAAVTCQDYFITNLYSDSGCTTALGRRATNFYQKDQNCSTTIMNPTCTKVGNNWIKEECNADATYIPDQSWVLISFFSTNACDNLPYAYLTGPAETCLFFNYENTFSFSTCSNGKSTFSQGSTCDFTGTMPIQNAGEACTPTADLGVKLFCPGQSTPSVNTPNAATPNAAPQAGNTPAGSTPQAATPAKKSSDAVTLGATALVFAAVLAF